MIITLSKKEIEGTVNFCRENAKLFQGAVNLCEHKDWEVSTVLRVVEDEIGKNKGYNAESFTKELVEASDDVIKVTSDTDGNLTMEIDNKRVVELIDLLSDYVSSIDSSVLNIIKKTIALGCAIKDLK
jgi:hypothetical protein